MKIKNILHAAALRFCLLVAAAIAVIAATAAYTATDPQPSTGTVAENLVSVTSFDFNAENVGDLASGTYYESNRWYYYGDAQDKLSTKGGEKCIMWGLNYGIVFKIAEAGEYTLTVSYYNSDKDNGIWVYKGTEHKGIFNADAGQSVKGKAGSSNPATCGTCTFTITTTEADECWQVSGITTGNEYLHSISLTKNNTTEPEDPEPSTLSPTFPSDIAAINSNTFWYHNGGPGLYTPGGATPVYKYLVANADAHAKDSNVAYAPTTDNMITINGDGTYKSYEIKPGDAIGFKLAPYYKSDNTYDEYRIKLYYYSEGEEAVLHTGNDAINTYQPVYPETTITIRDSGGDDTGTRMKTYHVSPYENTVYWVKNNNTDGQSLYLGGFEILKKNNGSPTGEFKGSWYVEDQAADLKNSNDNGKVVGSIAQSHDGVVMGIVTMPINNYEAIEGKKSVMFNWGSDIGVTIPAGATLSFNYTADDKGDGITIVGKTLSDDTNATSNYNKFSGYKGTVSYTNDTGTAETVWLQGKSANYAYFSGFEVTGGEVDPTPSIDNATPIDKDYVWYPVERKYVYGSNVYTDEHENVFVYTDFQIKSGSTTGEMIKPEQHTLHGNDDAYFYRTDKYTQLGFKIAQGKKGVINFYYIQQDNRKVELFKSGNPANLGSAIGTTHKVNDNGNVVIATQFHFDTSGGEDTFWLRSNGNAAWFGGFEVLFDEANNGGQNLTKDVAYTVSTTATITNALGTDTHPVFKSVAGNPVGGASMMIYKPGAVEAVAVGGNTNGVIVKMPADCKMLNVKGYLAGGASFKIYRGTAAAPNTTKPVEISGSGNIDKTASLDDLSDISGDVYWITSDDAAGAYVTSVTPKDGNFDTLQPTDVNYIYKVNGVPSSDNGGVQNSGDCNGRIMFVDQNNAAWIDSNSKMNVLGTEVSPVVVENGTDFFAVKVDEGPNNVKTGYVKVYFNGGNAGNHKMEELPLDDPMYSGWNSSYDRDSHVISFDSNGGGRGWWFGNEGAGARDLSAYNKINIQLGEVTGSPNLQVVVQCSNGAFASFPADLVNNRILGDLDEQSNWNDGDNGAKFDITKISQIYIQDNNVDDTNATVKITSARLMNKPVVIATDNDADPANGYTEVFGGKIYNMADGYVYEYPFDLNKVTPPQHIWITGAGAGTLNIAAIEVLYDSNHAKVVDWYVNKDTKMIVGSDDPAFKMKFQGKTLEYPEGYDEYVTFYTSSGRVANISFIMPEAVCEVYDWERALADANASLNDKDYVIENDVLKKSYGKHTIEVIKDSKYNPSGITMQDRGMTYKRDQGQKKGMNSITGDLYNWYTYTYSFPNDETKLKADNYWAGVEIKATQKKDGSDETDIVGGKTGQWRIFMRFVSYKAPVASNSSNSNSVTVTSGQGKQIYYTLDSSDPENLAVIKDKEHSSTESYSSSVNVSGMNCIFKAAEYIDTDYYFYDDISKGKDAQDNLQNVLKVVSKDLPIINDDPSVVYVKNKELDGEELFNVQDGGYMLTIPTGRVSDSQLGWVKEYYKNKDGKYLKKDGTTTTSVSDAVRYYDQPYNANPLMYLTLGGKDKPYLNGNVFNMCGTNWKASNDGGLKTYLDSYQFKFDVDAVNNPDTWQIWDAKEQKYVTVSGTQNQNPYTECNMGPGGADTEDGGMFLQPISGTMLRFEPEYDGVITVWLRQNGCLENNTQENGIFQRRPVFVMDENGRIMRRSTIRPTAAHYMGINGTWAINSDMCEQRSQVEHTWLFEVAKQAFANHPLYANRFGDDFPNRWEKLDHDHSGHILYGWWYKGFDLSATRSTITSADHVSRFEYMNPELLYRSDNIYNMEMNGLGLENKFAKYGYELPNFQYVRYRIPVKAGKTYYIAGRGTKNGFSAIRFDALAPNTNINGLSDLLYTDNPTVEENDKVDMSSADYLKLNFVYDDNGKRNYKNAGRSTYDLTGKTTDEVNTAYASVPTVTIKDYDPSNNASEINKAVYVNGNNGKINGMDDLGNLVGKTVNVELIREFRAYNWHPIILPFSLSETRVEQYFGEGTVILYLDPYAHTVNNQLDETTGKSWISAVSPALEGTKLSFTYHRYQMLYANTPAFICPTFTWSNDEKKKPAYDKVKPEVNGNSVSSITFKRVTLDGSNSRNFITGDNHSGYIGYAISNDYEVVGSYDQTVQSGDIYFVNNKSVSVTDANPHGTEAQLVHSNGYPVTMKGTRVWIRPRTGVVNAAPILTVGSKGFSDFEEDSESAGISDIVADDYTIEGYDIYDDGVYDLLGRKVGQGSLDGLLKGVYIFQGKKVYVK